MFCEASSFNQALANFDTSKVTDMDWMFMEAFSFNQPLNSFDTSNITTMKEMFKEASSFNQDIFKWDTSKCKNNMRDMFKGAPTKKADKPKGARGWF